MLRTWHFHFPPLAMAFLGSVLDFLQFRFPNYFRDERASLIPRIAGARMVMSLITICNANAMQRVIKNVQVHINLLLSAE